MNKREKLENRNSQLAGNIAALLAAAEAESRNLTTEEQAQFDAQDAEFQANERELANLKRADEIQARASAPAPRVVQPENTTSTTGAPRPGATSHGHAFSGGTPVAHNYANHGFTKGEGEFLVAVMNARNGRADPRLMVNAVTTFGNEGTAADGAFALPPQFASSLLDAVIPGDSFIKALNPVATQSNLLVVPTNIQAPWSTSGITAAATAEGAAITASKASLNEVRVPLYKFAALVHVSEETLEDIPFMASWVMNQMSSHLRYKLENAIVNGSGEGEPLGILNSGALISLSDADSTATTIGAVDVLSMEAGLLEGGGAFWLGSPTVFPAIASMKTGSAGYPLFQPDMSVPSKQALLGRPFYRSEACPAINTAGDLTLVAPQGYIFATKSSGIQTATTVGFAFDQQLQSFRAVLRAGGAPVLSTKVTRANGSTYASHFLTLAGSRS